MAVPAAAIVLVAAGTFLGLKLAEALSGRRRFVPCRLVPGSPDQIRVFEQAARMIGVPPSWASSHSLIRILTSESDGWVGIPNYQYGDRSKDKTRWAEVHDELRRNVLPDHSSATGLGQLIIRNVDAHYPSGRLGIGVAVEEAAGMLSYIKRRYGTPDEAWRCYGRICPEYGKTFQEGY
jgi:hypothetical protein